VPVQETVVLLTGAFGVHAASARDSGKIAVQPITTIATVANEAALRLTNLSLAAENSSARQGARRKP
jgi:uncharacterized membrane protein YgdD (TMEM256/DUF423 family)